MNHLTVVDHPLVQHKLTLMRMVEQSTSGFRAYGDLSGAR